MTKVKSNSDHTKVIPRLGNPKVPYRDWKLALEAYLGKSHLAVYVKYKVMAPVLLGDKDTGEGKFAKSAAMLSRKSICQTYDISSPDTPLKLFKMLGFGTVLCKEHLLGLYCTDPKEFGKGRMDYASSIAEVRSIIRSSLTRDLKHYVDGDSDIFEVYTKLQKHFETQRVMARRKLSTLEVKDLEQYIRDFKKQYAKYQMYGGVETREITEEFIYNIPSSYGASKLTRPSDSLQNALSFFTDVVDKQSTRFRKPDKNLKISVNRFQTGAKAKSDSVIRCFACGGFGHPKSMCATQGKICVQCGSREHTKTECTLKTLQVKCLEIVDYTEEGQDDITEPEVEMENDDLLALNFLDIFTIDLRHISTQDTYQCTCRFKHNCLHPLLDGGASAHVTGDSALLKDVVQVNDLAIRGALATNTIDTVKGTLDMKLDNDTILKIKDVTYVPNLGQTILSESKLMEDNYDIIKTGSTSVLSKNVKVVTQIQPLDNHFFLRGQACTTDNQVQIMKTEVLSSQLPHFRLGHLNNDYLLKEGLSTHRDFCVGCAAAKLVHKPKANDINPDTTKLMVAKSPLEKLHVDTIGPLKSSYRGYKYSVVIVCAFTGHLFVILVKEKTTISSKLINLLKSIQNRYNHQIKTIFSDEGTEFNKIQKYCEKNEISREKSSVYFPSENGRVERQNRSIVQMTKAMLYQTGCNTYFWCYSMQYATEILNNMKRKQEKSAHELLTQKKSDIERLKVFRARGFAIFDKTKKLEYSKPIIFLGFQEGTAMALVFDIKSKKVRVARDYCLDEKASIESALLKFRNSSLPTTTKPQATRKSGKANADNELDFESLDAPTSETKEQVSQDPEPQPISTTPSPSNSTNPANFTDLSDTNIISGKRTRKQVKKLTILSIAKLQDPKSYGQLAKREDEDAWKAAYQKEIQSLEGVGEFEVVGRPSSDITVIPLIEVFRSKYGINEEIVRKVRICARGDDKQLEKLRAETTYAPVASIVATRVFIGVALRFEDTIRQMNVSCAFLYGRLNEDIYLELPKGHPSRAPNRVWRTRASIYGLVQSPRVWNEAIDATLHALGFKNLMSE